MAKDLGFTTNLAPKISAPNRQDEALRKLVTAWNSRNVTAAKRVGTFGFMAATLSACGGSGSGTSATSGGSNDDTSTFRFLTGSANELVIQVLNINLSSAKEDTLNASDLIGSPDAAINASAGLAVPVGQTYIGDISLFDTDSGGISASGDGSLWLLAPASGFDPNGEQAVKLDVNLDSGQLTFDMESDSYTIVVSDQSSVDLNGGTLRISDGTVFVSADAYASWNVGNLVVNSTLVLDFRSTNMNDAELSKVLTEFDASTDEGNIASSVRVLLRDDEQAETVFEALGANTLLNSNGNAPKIEVANDAGDSVVIDLEALIDSKIAFTAQSLDRKIDALELKLMGATEDLDAGVTLQTLVELGNALAALQSAASGEGGLEARLAAAEGKLDGITSTIVAEIADVIDALEQKMQGEGVLETDFTTLKVLADAIDALAISSGDDVSALQAAVGAPSSTDGEGNPVPANGIYGLIETSIATAVTGLQDQIDLINNSTDDVDLNSIAELRAAVETLREASLGEGGISDALASLQQSLAGLDIASPSVVDITLTASGGDSQGALNAGDIVTATVAFSEAVLVTGSPTLKLDVGGQVVEANLAGGTGTEKLSFTYTITTGDSDADGISVPADALQLNGSATIRDSAGNNAVLTSTATADTSMTVDNTPVGLTMSAGALFGSEFDADTVAVGLNETGGPVYLSDLNPDGTYSVPQGDRFLDLDLYFTAEQFLEDVPSFEQATPGPATVDIDLSNKVLWTSFFEPVVLSESTLREFLISEFGPPQGLTIDEYIAQSTVPAGTLSLYGAMEAGETIADDVLAQMSGSDPADVSLTVTSPLTVAQANALVEYGFVVENMTYSIRDYDTTVQGALVNPATADILRGADQVTAIGDELDNEAMRFTSFDQRVNLRIEGLDGDDQIDAGRGDDEIVGGLGADIIELTYRDNSDDAVVYQTIYDGKTLPVTSLTFSSDANNYQEGSVLTVQLNGTSYQYTTVAGDTVATALQGFATAIEASADVGGVIVKENALEIFGATSATKLTVVTDSGAEDTIVDISNPGQKTRWKVEFSDAAGDYPNNESAGGTFEFDRKVYVTIAGEEVSADIVYTSPNVADPVQTVAALKTAIEVKMGSGQPFENVLDSVTIESNGSTNVRLVLEGKTAPATDSDAPTFSVTNAKVDAAGTQQQTTVSFSSNDADYYEGGTLSVEIGGVSVTANMVAGDAAASVQALVSAVENAPELSGLESVEQTRDGAIFESTDVARVSQDGTLYYAFNQDGSFYVLDTNIIWRSTAADAPTYRIDAALERVNGFYDQAGSLIDTSQYQDLGYVYFEDVDAFIASLKANGAVDGAPITSEFDVAYNSDTGDLAVARKSGGADFSLSTPYLTIGQAELGTGLTLTAATEATDPLSATATLSYEGEYQQATISLEDASQYNYLSDGTGLSGGVGRGADVYFDGGKVYLSITETDPELIGGVGDTTLDTVTVSTDMVVQGDTYTISLSTIDGTPLTAGMLADEYNDRYAAFVLNSTHAPQTSGIVFDENTTVGSFITSLLTQSYVEGAQLNNGAIEITIDRAQSEIDIDSDPNLVNNLLLVNFYGPISFGGNILQVDGVGATTLEEGATAKTNSFDARFDAHAVNTKALVDTINAETSDNTSPLSQLLQGAVQEPDGTITLTAAQPAKDKFEISDVRLDYEGVKQIATVDFATLDDGEGTPVTYDGGQLAIDVYATQPDGTPIGDKISISADMADGATDADSDPDAEGSLAALVDAIQAEIDGTSTVEKVASVQLPETLDGTEILADNWFGQNSFELDFFIDTDGDLGTLSDRSDFSVVLEPYSGPYFKLYGSNFNGSFTPEQAYGTGYRAVDLVSFLNGTAMITESNLEIGYNDSKITVFSKEAGADYTVGIRVVLDGNDQIAAENESNTEREDGFFINSGTDAANAGGRLAGIVNSVTEENGVITLTSADSVVQQFKVDAATASDPAKPEITKVTFSSTDADYFVTGIDPSSTEGRVSVTIDGATYVVTMEATAEATMQKLADAILYGQDNTGGVGATDPELHPDGTTVAALSTATFTRSGSEFTFTANADNDLLTISGSASVDAVRQVTEISIGSSFTDVDFIAGIGRDVSVTIAGQTFTIDGATRLELLQDLQGKLEAAITADTAGAGIAAKLQTTGIVLDEGEGTPSLTLTARYGEADPLAVSDLTRAGFDVDGEGNVEQEIQIGFTSSYLGEVVASPATLKVDLGQSSVQYVVQADDTATDIVAGIASALEAHVLVASATVVNDRFIDIIAASPGPNLLGTVASGTDNTVSLFEVSGDTSVEITAGFYADQTVAGQINLDNGTPQTVGSATDTTPGQSLVVNDTTVVTTDTTQVAKGQSEESVVVTNPGTGPNDDTSYFGDADQGTIDAPLPSSGDYSFAELTTSFTNLVDPLVSNYGGFSITNDLSTDGVITHTFDFSAFNGSSYEITDTSDATRVMSAFERSLSLDTIPDLDANTLAANGNFPSSSPSHQFLVLLTDSDTGNSYLWSAATDQNGTFFGGNTATLLETFEGYTPTRLAGVTVKQTYTNPGDGYTAIDASPQLDDDDIGEGDNTLFGSDPGVYDDDGLLSTWLSGGTPSASDVDGEGTNRYTSDGENDLTTIIDVDATVAEGAAASTSDLGEGAIDNDRLGLASFEWDEAATTVLSLGNPEPDVIYNFQTGDAGDVIAFEGQLLNMLSNATVSGLEIEVTEFTQTLNMQVSYIWGPEEGPQFLGWRYREVTLDTSELGDQFTVTSDPILWMRTDSGTQFSQGLSVGLKDQTFSSVDELGQAYMNFINNLEQGEIATYSINEGDLTLRLIDGYQFNSATAGATFYTSADQTTLIKQGFDLGSDEYANIGTADSGIQATDLNDAQVIATRVDEILDFSSTSDNGSLNATIFAVTASDDDSVTAIWAHQQSSSGDSTVEALELYHLATVNTIDGEFGLSSFGDVEILQSLVPA